MTDEPTSPYQQPEPQAESVAPPPPPPTPAYGAPTAPPPAPQAYAGAVADPSQLGKIRSTGVCILLFIVTLGIYGLFWYYNTHEEMKRHSGQGIGGVVALILGFFISIVMVFLTPNEVGKLYEHRGQKAPVSALTGLWILLPLVGGIVWFVKTNGALNDYWRSLGAS
ncbi:MAG: DUF4234 domain-containing protein [Nocardioides sp.]